MAEPETKPSHPKSDVRFSLQLKLTLAFVFVSMIGFYVAFRSLPQLYVRSWNADINDAQENNAQVVRNRYAAEVELKTPHPIYEKFQTLSERLLNSEGFNFAGIDLPDRGLDPKEVISLLSENRSGPGTEEIRNLFESFEAIFGIVRILPWKVDPLEKRISIFWDEAESRGELPFTKPIDLPERGIVGTLAVAKPLNVSLWFDADVPESEWNQAGLRAASDVLFLRRSEIEEYQPVLLQHAKKFSSRGYWDPTQHEVETVVDPELGQGKERRQFVPVDDLEKKGTLAGLVRISYRAPSVGVYAWKELVGREGYLALGFAGLVAIVFSYVFAKGITRPVGALTRAATAIADGRLDRDVRVSTRDEIGVLAQTFNEMRVRLASTLHELQQRAETIEKQKSELDRQYDSLQALQSYTERVLATVDSPIFSVDMEGRVRRPNRAAEDLLRIRDGRVLEEQLNEPISERTRAALETGETTLSEETTVVSEEGEEIPVALSVSPLREGGKITGAVSVLTDLSAIKNLEAAVSRQERLAALGQLTAGVAHEIRNPLSIIKACAEILQQKFGDRPGENGLCQDILEETNRLSRVITDFLTFARPIEPDCQTTRLNDWLESQLEKIERSGMGDWNIEFDRQTEIPPVEVDRDQLEQVLLNLVRNGLEAMGGRGTLRMSTFLAENGRCVCIEVEDRGEGMDEETRRRIFDPFFTSKAEGTGLGLSICHRILEAHGGTIEVASSEPGKGTVIRVSLPRSERSAFQPVKGEAAFS